MKDQGQPPSSPLLPVLPPAPRKPRFVRVRQWLRSRTGRSVVPLIALFMGIFIAIAGLFLYGSSGEGQRVVGPAPTNGAIIIRVDRAFLTQLVTQNLRESGMPGHIQNVRVDLAQGDLMTINGDDVFTLVAVQVTKHFVLVVQPYVSECVLQVHVVHGDVSSIPVTGFAQIFENHVNEQLRKKPEGLPSGFVYCTTGVRTDPTAMFVTYAATPV